MFKTFVSLLSGHASYVYIHSLKLYYASVLDVHDEQMGDTNYAQIHFNKCFDGWKFYKPWYLPLFKVISHPCGATLMSIFYHLRFNICCNASNKLKFCRKWVTNTKVKSPRTFPVLEGGLEIRKIRNALTLLWVLCNKTN